MSDDERRAQLFARPFQAKPDAVDSDEHDQSAANGVACPFCRSRDVELFALFGSQLLTDQYYCNACHTPFEHLTLRTG